MTATNDGHDSINFTVGVGYVQAQLVTTLLISQQPLLNQL